MWDGTFMPKALYVPLRSFKDDNRWAHFLLLRPDRKWQHEQGSEMMLDFMISEYDIPIPEKDQLFIKALIAGEPSNCR